MSATAAMSEMCNFMDFTAYYFCRARPLAHSCALCRKSPGAMRLSCQRCTVLQRRISACGCRRPLPSSAREFSPVSPFARRRPSQRRMRYAAWPLENPAALPESHRHRLPRQSRRRVDRGGRCLATRRRLQIQRRPTHERAALRDDLALSAGQESMHQRPAHDGCAVRKARLALPDRRLLKPRQGLPLQRRVTS